MSPAIRIRRMSSDTEDTIRRRTVLERTTAGVLFGLPGGKGAKIYKTNLESELEEISASPCEISRPEIKRGDWPHQNYSLQATNSVPEVEGVDADSLRLDWEHDFDAEKLTTPIVSGNRVFVASRAPKTRVIAVDHQRGRALWEREMELLTHATPSYSNGLNVSSSYMGNQRFTSIGDDSSTSARFDGADSKTDYLLATKEALIAGVSGQTPELRAYNRSTNELCWKLSLEDTHFEISSIAVDDNAIYAGVKGMETDYPDFGEIFAVDVDKKRIEWAFAMDTPVHSVSVKEGDLICLTDSAVISLDRESGEENWQTPVSSGTSAGPAVADDTVVFGDVYSVRAVERSSGEKLWERELSGTNAKPTISGDRVYVSHGRPRTNNGKVTVLDTHSGDSVSEVNTGEERLSRPVVVSGSVLISSKSGRVLKYEGGD